jgi:Ca2+-binding RTX toxin-like protein
VRNSTTTTAQITNNKFFGLTSSQIAAGPNVQTGNQFLATEPPLDTSHPWSQTALLSIGLVSDTGSSASDGITSNPAVKGTGQASTAVTIKEGAAVLGTPTADSTGAWSYPLAGLLDGAHTLTASQTNLAGTTATATLSFTLDKTAPVLSIALVEDNGTSSTDKITSNPAIKGTGQANTLVTIKEGSVTLGTVTADSTGAWSFAPAGLLDGVHNLTVSQTDLAGNTGTATLSFTLDSTLGATALYGTPGNDVLTGTIIGLNVIYGLGGNDTISVSYDSATTQLYGGDGDDIITGSLWGADYIDGGPGGDTISGNWGNDTILGGDGNDHIDGGAGDDVLYTGSGNDYVQGGYGNDTIYCGPGTNQVDGGPGTDTAVFAGNYASYGLSFANGVTTVAGIEGTSSLTNIETIKFNDGSYNVLTGLFQA